MAASLQKVMQQVERLARERIASRPVRKVRDYSKDPVGYMENELGVKPWSVQREICEKLLQPPYKVLVKAGHSVGKTWLAAALTSWFFDTFSSGAGITTAPTHRDVVDLLWREVRMQRHKLGGFRGDASPELWAAHDRYCKGFTAKKGESFVGRHQERMLFCFDEAVGIESLFWTTTSSMFKPDGKHYWIAIFNPTDASSQAAIEERTGGWATVSMSCLDHPNIQRELQGLPQLYPGAVSLAQVESWIRDWAEPIDPGDRKVTDLEWPPNSGKWIRPGPLFECRVLGRWPSQAAYSVWSESLWSAVLATRHELTPAWPIQGGVDVARFGDDMTVIHFRQGRCSIHHESHNGWSTSQTAGRLKQLCHQFQNERQPMRSIPCMIDVTGVGAGVVDQADGFSFVGVNSSELARQEDRFWNVRSELWWAAADIAKAGGLDVSRIPEAAKLELGRQLLAPMYDVDQAGRLRVEDKAATKKRIRCSPDSADAFNLCYYTHAGRERVSGAIG